MVVNAKIGREAIEAADRVSKGVYQEFRSRTNGLNEVEERFAVNRNSAADYIRNFGQMRKGELYRRTFNASATDYFPEMIGRDFGPDALQFGRWRQTLRARGAEPIGAAQTIVTGAST